MQCALVLKLLQVGPTPAGISHSSCINALHLMHVRLLIITARITIYHLPTRYLYIESVSAMLPTDYSGDNNKLHKLPDLPI